MVVVHHKSYMNLWELKGYLLDMEAFIHGALGGIIPAALMVFFYIVTVSGRLAKIETNICWLIKYIEKCLPH